MRKILVLGSEGFIGNHLVHYFAAKNNEVYGCDLYETSLKGGYKYFKVSRLSPEWDELFSAHKFDFCINASGSGNVPYSMTHPYTDFEANALDVVRILDTIRRFDPQCRYLHISSAAVYGNPVSLPVSENSALHPLSPYGWHKMIAENICSEYNGIYGIRVSQVRPFSVYGDGLRKQLLWDICSKLQTADEIKLFGTGMESRDFIHVKDVVNLMECIVDQSAFNNEIYNAASGTETAIREVADLFEQYFKGKKKILFSGETRQGDPVNWKADVTKAKSIGFVNRIQLGEGVHSYINWFISLHKSPDFI